MNRERAEGQEPFDREELSRLLPSPGDPVLSEDRRLVVEEFLMREMRRDAETNERKRAQAARGRRRMALIAVPVAVVALAVGSVFVFQSDDGSGREPGGTEQPAQALPTVAQVVERASLAASREELPVPEAGQFIYIKSADAYGGSSVGDPVTSETWKSPDGLDGWLIDPERAPEPGVTLAHDPEECEANVCIEYPDGVPGSYTYLQNLPRDPEELLDVMYELNGTGSSGPDAGAFTMIGDMIRNQLVPSDLAPSFYQAAALIPGVTVVGDVTDALGREGIALARVDEVGDHREEWIFDEETYTYLGSRGVTASTGEVISISAIIERTVVDEMRQRPGDGSGGSAA